MTKDKDNSSGQSAGSSGTGASPSPKEGTKLSQMIFDHSVHNKREIGKVIIESNQQKPQNPKNGNSSKR
ncbi:hypothetical protein [Microvirga sp. 2TAF3]|uniref:hypothetical protein n=1 Tax=Microvirga sp. 2TAF3 TaxID=3233014 RepID=UPI003F9BC2BD